MPQELRSAVFYNIMSPEVSQLYSTTDTAQLLAARECRGQAEGQMPPRVQGAGGNTVVEHDHLMLLLSISLYRTTFCVYIFIINIFMKCYSKWPIKAVTLVNEDTYLLFAHYDDLYRTILSKYCM